MTRSGRWTLLVVAAVAVLVAALVVELGDDSADGGVPPSAQVARAHRDADTPEALAGPRQRADLAPCPAGGQNPGPTEPLVAAALVKGPETEHLLALAGL
jgi:hypothetical protein